MNPKQITHFVYWLQERTDLRGIQTEKNPNRNATPLTPRIKLATIEDLQDEFLGELRLSYFLTNKLLLLV